MIKILGVAIVIFAGICFGFSKAAKEQRRLEQGVELKRMLYLLQGEIRYGFTPLPEAIAVIAKKVSKDLRPFLQQTARQLETFSEESFWSVWKKNMDEFLRPLIVEEKLLDPVLAMGESIGYLDKEMQEKTIAFAIEQIEEQIFQMKDQVIKNCRMYRSLGLSFSLLIVIILV